MHRKTIAITAAALAIATLGVLIALRVTRGPDLQIPYTPPVLAEDAPERFVRYLEDFRPVEVKPDSIIAVEVQQTMAYIHNVVGVRAHWELEDAEEALSYIRANEALPPEREDPDIMPIEEREQWAVLTYAFSALRNRMQYDGPMSPGVEDHILDAMLGYIDHEHHFIRMSAILTLTLEPGILSRPHIRRAIRERLRIETSEHIHYHVDNRLRRWRRAGLWEGDL